MPEADLVWWPVASDRGVEPMMRKRFPKLRIVKGAVDRRRSGKRSRRPPAGARVGGGDLGGTADCRVAKMSKKPYGFFGVGFTIGGEAASAAASAANVELAKRAAFSSRARRRRWRI